MDQGKSENRKPGFTWLVFSDRSNNATYDGPSSNTIKKKANFLEQFFVAEETEKRLHIIKDPDLDQGNFSPSAEDYGWIDKQNLLLWDHCIVTNPGKINKKGMILHTIESIKNEEITSGQAELIAYYFNPQLTDKTEKKSRIYEVLYIYKISDNAVLLGKHFSTDDKHIKEDIFGWVDLRKLTVWDHRIAIEPNFLLEAANERRAHNIKASFMIDELRAKRYRIGEQIPERYIGSQDDPYEKRRIGEWKRYPLLDYNKETGIIQVGVMSELRSLLNRQDTISTVGLADIQERYNQLRANARNINIVFVVDGTKSMDPYFNAINQAIRASIDRLYKEYTKNTLRFGIVIYTDFAEGMTNLTRIKKLTDKHQEVITWMAGQRSIHNLDPDYPEAVFYGILTALRGTGMQKDETNIIVLVGDAGNHDRSDASQVDKDQLARLLFDYNCNLLGFQVNNGPEATYDEFQEQIKDLIITAANLKYQQNLRTSAVAGYRWDVPKFRSYQNNTYSVDTNTLIGTLVCAIKGAPPVSTVRLQQEIDKSVQFSSHLTDRNLAILERIIGEGESFTNVIRSESTNSVDQTGSVASGTCYTPAVIDLLRQLGIPEEKLKIILQENYQLYIPLYSSMNIDGLQYPIFKRSLFMSLYELGELLHSFETLINSATGGEQAMNMKKAWISLMKTHLGDAYNQDDIDSMTIEEINEKVFGLPGTSEFLKNRLGDLTDPSIVDENALYNYTMQIKSKRSKLMTIYNGKNYEYGFFSYDAQYFWIDQELLP